MSGHPANPIVLKMRVRQEDRAYWVTNVTDLPERPARAVRPTR
jgi:hypothetical protein